MEFFLHFEVRRARRDPEQISLDEVASYSCWSSRCLLEMIPRSGGIFQAELTQLKPRLTF